MVQKIVINKCYGGFGLSRDAMDLYCEMKGCQPGKWNDTFEYYEDFPKTDRTDPILHQVIELLGSAAASGKYSKLKVVEVPDGVVWEINEYDGIEWVAEKHQTWS